MPVVLFLQRSSNKSAHPSVIAEIELVGSAHPTGYPLYVDSRMKNPLLGGVTEGRGGSISAQIQTLTLANLVRNLST
jgi:hypothetical protein